jgi:hypothetical protein
MDYSKRLRKMKLLTLKNNLLRGNMIDVLKI